MRLRSALLFFLLSFCAPGLRAQVTLFAENFDNGCVLPAGWEVNLTGNQNPVWYVGNALQNDDEHGLSMNGSCFLVIDDDATGNNTPAYVADFVSPPFDASQFPNVSLSVDVHYRDYGPDSEYFQVLLTDGITEIPLRTFAQGGSTGDSLFEYTTLKFDLSFLTTSPTARLIFRYNDNGGFAWWAAFDNIQVVGSGDGQNIIKEAFNDCVKPAGWETQIVTGVDDWQFGLETNPKTINAGTSMDGTCMAFFDDDLIGAAAPFSTVRLFTPWFDGTLYGQFELNFDMIMRYYSEKASIYVQHADGSEYLVREAEYDLGGPHFPNYIHGTLDLSPFRDQQMRVIFEYDDGQQWAWWIGLDNVKITGSGVANDICSNAQQIVTGTNCLTADNRTALFDGPLPDCIAKPVASLWYTWKADFTGMAKFSTGANFNDVVNVYTGDCASPQPLICNDHDEHGFIGEDTYFPAQQDQLYYIRVCGKEGGYGVSRGDLCLKIEHANTLPPTPANDNCANAVPLAVGAPCQLSNNLNATTSATTPSLNALARADIWYQFTAPTLAPGEVLELNSNANFSDILTIYSGTCNGLTEVAGNHKGASLHVSDLTAGQSYFLQIAGTFATVEGAVCPQILKKLENAPANNDCFTATDLTIGVNCTSGSNIGASFSGYTPPCVPTVTNDIWFKFIAPASGAIRFNTSADFQHVAAIWRGDCNALNPVFCVENPLRCDGFVTVGSLSAGQPYFLQIASQVGAVTTSTGNVCIRMIDGNDQPDFTPLTLDIAEECVDVDMAALHFTTSGGVSPFSFSGNFDGETLTSGTTYFAVVTDAMGCEKSITGIVDECTGSLCNVAATLAATQPTCFGATNGAIVTTVSGGISPYLYNWSNGANTAEITDLGSGTYTVTITDALGCDQVSSITLASPAQIVVAVANLIQPSQGQSDGAIAVDITGGTGQYTANWYLNGVLVAMGVEDITAAAAGDYQLQVTDANGCTAALDVVLTATSSTKDVAEASFSEVYPNPAKDKTMLTVAFPQPRTLYITLSDASGRALHTWTESNVTEKNIPVDLKTLAAGTYQLRVVTGFETFTEKIVIAK